jgi:hypothetical protein
MQELLTIKQSSPGVTGEKQATLPAHLCRLPGDEWAVWRCAALRGAGFSIDSVLRLASPECATAADELLAAQEAARQSRRDALSLIHKELDTLRTNSEWENVEKRTPLVKAMRRLSSGKPISPGAVVSDVDRAAKEVCLAGERTDAALSRFRHAFKAALTSVSEAIHQTAGTESFREAVLWQNRNGFHTGLTTLLRRQPGEQGRSSKQRQHEEMVANYLQRYGTKNDTIGFFGPVGWANLVPNGEILDVKPGARLLASRSVYFEGWCIDALAESFVKDKAFRPWLAPRRMPYIRVAGRTLHQPFKAPAEISLAEAAILQACDGEHTAKDIARELVGAFPTGLIDEEVIYGILETLHEGRLISWTFETPVELHPERTLQRLLERVEDESLRAPAIKALEELEAVRAAVAAAAGDVKKLDESLGRMEETFSRLTGVAPTRAAGKTYASRTLLYEDCRRDIEVTIGPGFLETLSLPLSLLLASARWLTFKAAELYRKAFREVYERLAEKAGSPVVEAMDFWFQSQSLLFGAKSCLVNGLVPVFQEHWSQILMSDSGARRVQYTSEQLRIPVSEAFAAPHAGWKSARYHSPDLMIAAADTEAIRRGDYQIVLGELHVGVNTLGASLFLSQHVAPEELYRALEVDFPEPRVMPVTPKYWAKQTTRTSLQLISPKDYRLETSPDSIHSRRECALPIADLVVEDSGGGLVVRTRDGALRFDIIEFFGETLNIIVPNIFKILPPRPHTPRVTIDRCVVSRETWNFSAEEIEFAFCKLEEERFLLARRWMKEHDLPRFVFVKTPVEVKPFYVDFDSPVYVETFAKMVRRSAEDESGDARISVSEMLPHPQQIWLPDAAGRRYTSEIRTVVVDLTT